MKGLNYSTRIEASFESEMTLLNPPKTDELHAREYDPPPLKHMKMIAEISSFYMDQAL